MRSAHNMSAMPLEVASFNFDHLSDDVDIPELIRDQANTLRFPEKMMLLMTFVENTHSKRATRDVETCISWTDDGDAVIIRNPNELVKNLLPHVIHTSGSFASFTRKLYRWGFRQKIKKPSLSTKGIKIFFHKHFRRDNKQLIANMKSVTVEKADRVNSTAPPKILVERSETTAADLNVSSSSVPVHQQRPLEFPFQHDSVIGLLGLNSPFLDASFGRGGHASVESLPLTFTANTYADRSTLLQNILAIEQEKNKQSLAITLQFLAALDQDRLVTSAHWLALRK